MINEKILLGCEMSLQDLELILTKSCYHRTKMNFLRNNGFKKLSEFSREIGYSKQFISKIINKQTSNTLPFDIDIIFEEKTIWIRMAIVENQ